MEDMVEKVARAICEADCGRVTPNELARCSDLARVAIEAMRGGIDAVLKRHVDAISATDILVDLGFNASLPHKEKGE